MELDLTLLISIDYLNSIVPLPTITSQITSSSALSSRPRKIKVGELITVYFSESGVRSIRLGRAAMIIGPGGFVVSRLVGV
jgi:hypothetical protein